MKLNFHPNNKFMKQACQDENVVLFFFLFIFNNYPLK